MKPTGGASPDRIGQVIAGRYKVVSLLGQGAFGFVYLAEQGEIGRKVVLKMLHPQWASDAKVVERFRREAMATDRVQHPNVCKVYDYNVTSDGVPFIAMEYLDGETFKSLVDREKSFELGRAASLLVPVVEAVGAAHAAGIVHRDLKLENLMLAKRDRPQPEPVVLDFGIAKLLDAAEKLTQTGSMLGTPTYMSPEQCRGQTQIGPASDVYSLAVITFQLLVGRPLYTARSVAELAMRHVMDPVPPLPGWPEPLARTLTACLAKEAERRPPATALAEALREAARAQPTFRAPDVAQSTAAPTAGAAAAIASGAASLPASSIAATVMSPSAGKPLPSEIARPGGAAPAKKGGLPLPLLLIITVVAMGAVGALLAILFK